MEDVYGLRRSARMSAGRHMESSTRWTQSQSPERNGVTSSCNRGDGAGPSVMGDGGRGLLDMLLSFLVYMANLAVLR